MFNKNVFDVDSERTPWATVDKRSSLFIGSGGYVGYCDLKSRQ